MPGPHDEGALLIKASTQFLLVAPISRALGSWLGWPELYLIWESGATAQRQPTVKQRNF